MAQAGFTPISLYYSTTAAATPSAGNLVAGELALNTVDEKLYFKNSAGTVKLLASNATSAPVLSFSAGTTGLTPNTATTGAVTLAGTLGTANGGTNLGGATPFTSGGVVYASSTSALATGSALTFDGTNLGVGVTPSAWGGSWRGFEVGALGSSLFAQTSGNNTYVTANAYFNGTNWIRPYAATASNYGQSGGAHTWSTAATSTAGSTITFTQAMTLLANGNLGLGVTPVGNSGNGNAIEISYGGTIHADAGNPAIAIASSAYRFDNDWKYKNGSFAPTRYTQGSGTHSWFTAPIGTTGNVISFSQVMTLDGSGNLGVGTTSTPYIFQVSKNNTYFFTDCQSSYVEQSTVGSSGANIDWYQSTKGTGSIIWRTNGTTERARINTGFSVGTTADPGAGAIYATGNITAYYSDARLKTVSGKIENALDKVAQLSGVYYTNNDIAKSFGYDSDEVQVGVLAQEVGAVLPEIVKAAPFDLDEHGNSKSGENYKTVQYERLVPLLIEAINELQAKVKALETH